MMIELKQAIASNTLLQAIALAGDSVKAGDRTYDIHTFVSCDRTYDDRIKIGDRTYDDRVKTGDRTCGDRVKAGDRTYDDRVKVGDHTFI